MKKSLFAIAAVTAFAGAAQAQSSVTVYGILDVGYVGGNERLSGVASNNTVSPGNTVLKQNVSTFNQSAESTSRLGFRGNEDLGGGMSAFFTLETQIDPNATTSWGNNRAAFVGLKKNGLGQAAIGLQNTVVTDAISPTITGQFNNIVGSMLFPGNTFAGPSSIRSNTGTNVALNTSSANGNTEAFTFRTSNTLKVQSDRFAGFTGSAMIVMNNETDTQGSVATGSTGYSGGKNNQEGWGLGANYQWKKLVVAAAYQAFKATDPYAVVTANGSRTTGGEAAFTSVGTGSNVKDNQAYVGASYDFGILKAYAGWIDRKVTSQIDSNLYAKRTAQEIGVRSFITPKVEGWASVGNGRVNTFGNSAPTANLIGWQIGSNYLLSKRTNLYAIYGQNSTSNVSINNSNPSSFTSNNYALGIRHTF